MKHAMLRWELTLRLTAACVVLAAALSQLTLARAEPQGGSASAAGDGAAKAATTEAEPRGPRPSVDDICRRPGLPAVHPHVGNDLSQRLVMLLQPIENIPNLIEVASHDRLFDAFATGLLKFTSRAMRDDYSAKVANSCP